MNYLLLLKDGIKGFIFFIVLSYITQLCNKRKNLLNILSFIWAYPTILILLIYVVYKNTKSKKILIDFLSQQLIGRFLGLLLIIILLQLKTSAFIIIFLTNLFITIGVFIIYFNKKLYNISF